MFIIIHKNYIIMEYDALLDIKEKCRGMVNVLIVFSLNYH
jgi:hypothetical protein